MFNVVFYNITKYSDFKCWQIQYIVYYKDGEKRLKKTRKKIKKVLTFMGGDGNIIKSPTDSDTQNKQNN